MEGKMLREHGDIDMFIENMDKNINELLSKLKTKQFTCSYYDDMQMLKLNKNNVKIIINPIIFENATAIWKHIGEQGFVIFPKEWLDTEYKEFHGINVLTSGYKFEYCIRTIMKYTNPNWENRIRDKDIQAKEYYEKILLENNIKGEELLDKIWSYNPYWLKDGYNGYENPVLVIGREYKKKQGHCT
jgi:hypothetical protein